MISTLLDALAILFFGQDALVAGDTDGMTISQDELTALTADLVAIDSTNPDFVPGGAGEAEIARFVAGWLSDAGLEAEMHELGSVGGRAVGHRDGVLRMMTRIGS